MDRDARRSAFLKHRRKRPVRSLWPKCASDNQPKAVQPSRCKSSHSLPWISSPRHPVSEMSCAAQVQLLCIMNARTLLEAASTTIHHHGKTWSYMTLRHCGCKVSSICSFAQLGSKAEMPSDVNALEDLRTEMSTARHDIRAYCSSYIETLCCLFPWNSASSCCKARQSQNRIGLILHLYLSTTGAAAHPSS